MNSWEKITEWHFVLPPSRPSQHHLGLLKDSLAQIPRSKPVAVLGSTPEFRDLLYRSGFQNIYVFERSTSAYNQMSRLRSYSNSENVIWGDWLDSLGDFGNTFALIASDLTSGNVEYDAQPKFYELISNALTNQGLFYDKILRHQEQKRPIKQLIEKYVDLPINLLTVNYFSCEFFFCSELLNIKKLVDSTMFYEILGEVDSPIIRTYLGECPKITPPGCFWYYGKSWNELRKIYSPGLKLIKEIDDEVNSPYFENLKLCLMEKL